MLDWESQRLDLEEGGLTEQTIAVKARAYVQPVWGRRRVHKPQKVWA
jgi:hypothetical protein